MAPKVDNQGARYDVAGLGNALVDALVRVEDDSILTNGGYNRGHMTPVNHAAWQDLYDKLKHLGVEVQSGGSCANSIAALGLMGVRSVYCGQVGRDEMGELYAGKMMEACGGHALHWTDAHHTGKCLSVISASDAERTLLTDLGAAVLLPGLGTFDDVIRESRLLHLTGYLLLGEPMASRAAEAIAVAEQAEIPISLDVADPFVVATVRDAMWEVVEEFVDIVFLNKEEAETLCECSVDEALEKLADVCDTVVIKLGREGSVVRRGDEIVRVGVHKVDAVDTTGAGDSYAAGFLYGWCRDWSLERSADLGSRVAALTVAQMGAVVRDRDLLATAIAAASAANA